MLIRFEVANFRSINEPAELSMVAVDAEREAARPVERMKERLLSVAGIYGANASGKSTVIAALNWLGSAAGNSIQNWGDAIPVVPFAFRSDPSAPTAFEIELTVNGVRNEYRLEVDRDAILYEALFHYPEGRRRRIFEREGDSIAFQRGLGGTAGIRELFSDRILTITAAMRFDNALINGFASQLRAMQQVYTNSNAAVARQQSAGADAVLGWLLAGTEFLNETTPNPLLRERGLALLRMADLGIEDAKFVAVEDGERIGRLVKKGRFELIHKAGDARIPFGLQDESDGTRAWLWTIGPVLDSLTNGTILLCDELDASLHPTLTAEILRLFHDPATNPHGAQLIFTSHDTSLLRHLNRDEVWFTEKFPDGATRLGALAEFAGERVRTSTNLEKGYLEGRFGALPMIDEIPVLRALGLLDG